MSAEERALRHEAHHHLAVWNRQPVEVIDRLMARGVTHDEASRIVTAVHRELRALQAPGARLSGAISLLFGVPSLAVGGVITYLLVTGVMRGVQRFPAAWAWIGVAMLVVGGVLTARGLFRIGSGRPERN